jgi:hypothetical protein
VTADDRFPPVRSVAQRCLPDHDGATILAAPQSSNIHCYED